MAYIPPNPNGQATAANSAPVVLASDQTLPLPSLAATSIKQGDGTQKTQVVDGSNTTITSLTSNGIVGLNMALAGTNFVVSATNSSSAQLAASATFTGTVETIFNQQNISVLVFSDQPGTLTLRQYIDAGGTQTTNTWVYSHLANVPISKCFTGNGNYFKATYQNTGGSTTTTFALNIAYGILPAVTEAGNSPMGLMEVNGTAISMGQGTMAASLPVVIASNQSAIPTTLTSTTLTGTSAVNVSQMNGVTVTMGSGVTGTGVQRVVLATDVALPTGSNVLGALTANQSVNVAQINGVTPLMGSGVNGTGASRVTLATDQAACTVAGLFSVKIDQTTPGTTNAVTDTKLPASAASADALTNPTITQIGADLMWFNGTSWDRARGGNSVATTTGDTGAKTTTGNGATITNVGNKGIQVFVVLGTVSGTTPTCVFKMQGSVDGGTNWYDIPGATTASLTTSVNVGIMLYPGIAVIAGTTTTGTTAGASGILPRTWRMVWTIGGTTPSFTITSITYNYIAN